PAPRVHLDVQRKELLGQPSTKVLGYVDVNAISGGMYASGEVIGVAFVVDKDVCARRGLFALGPHAGRARRQRIEGFGVAGDSAFASGQARIEAAERYAH